MDNNTPLVLVVDDQPTMRFFASEILSRAGFSVIEAEHGKEALQLFGERTPDFILLDVMMPEMDGFEACEEIRKMSQGAHVPILMMTGLDDEQAINRAYDAGATDFVGKPISRLVLPHRVRYMLRAKQTADWLRESEARLADAQRLAKLGNWQWEMNRQFVDCSDVCKQVLDLDGDRFAGEYEVLLENVSKDEQTLIRQAVEVAIKTNTAVSLEHTVSHSAGNELIVYHAVEAVTDDNGQVQRVIGTVQDITERKKAEERIRSLAYSDQLTGLSNRTYLKEFLAGALKQARRYDQIMALLYLDLDHFKRVNDTLGHSAGDQLLREVAARLRQCIRGADAVARPLLEDISSVTEAIPSNSIARLGGDEFIIVLSQLQDATAAAQVAQRVIDVLTEPFTLEGHEVFITTSVGITLFPTDGDDEETLLKNADVAMYHAKDKGRNNFQFFKDSLNATVLKRLSLENNLRKAIDRDEFTLNYQPKVDLASGTITGTEALLRWYRNGKNFMSPQDFIPFAEESGLIVPIGNWVLRHACEQSKAWQARGLAPMRVAVNLSARQFKEKDLVQQIKQAIVDTDIDPSYLELEITEGLLMEDVDSARRILTELKDMGVVIAIDDFGTGYSSLSYLKRFPIDILKIDRSFIMDLSSDPDNQAITRAIISMAHSLNLAVVAEGVETDEQLQLLSSYECDEIQGYIYSPPVAADDIASLLESNAFRGEIAQRAVVA